MTSSTSNRAICCLEIRQKINIIPNRIINDVDIALKAAKSCFMGDNWGMYLVKVPMLGTLPKPSIY